MNEPLSKEQIKKAKKKAQDKRYRDKNKEKLSAKSREYYEANKESIKDRVRNYTINNQDKIKAYRDEKRDKRNEQRKEWGRKNPHKQKEYHQTAKAKNEELRKQLSDIPCAAQGCENFLNLYQVKLGTKHCSRKCQLSGVPKMKPFDIEIPYCDNPDCDIKLTRKQAIQGRRYCGKQCSAVHNNGFIQYNPRACEFFRCFDIVHGIEGQYATNGGEHFIPKLGYWLDYFNKDVKLIIEWDESHHYLSDGSLRDKDVKRQQSIESYYNDFEFIRIKQ